MHSRRRYKICVCSDILQGNLWVFQITSQDFNVLFPKILVAIERSTKVGIFLIPVSITFLNPKILVFLFLRKLA